MKHSPTAGAADADDVGPGGDPWAAFGYLVAGVAFYGAIGWFLSVWLKGSYWIPIGIVVGAGFGTYMVFSAYAYRGDGGAQHDLGSSLSDGEVRSSENKAARAERPECDDRGETA